MGLIAQEVEQIIPEAVSETNNIKHISYSMITSTLIKSVQEMNNKINKLEEENKFLKENINKIYTILGEKKL